MAIDFVANEGDCWIANAVISNSSLGVDLTRVRSGSGIATGSWTTAESRTLPARTAGEVTWRTQNNSNWQNGTSNFFWRAAGDTEVLRIQNTATGTQQLQYWNGSAWVGVGSPQAVTQNAILRARLVYSGLGTTNGSLTLTYINVSSGVTENTWSASGLDLTNCPSIAKMGLRRQTTGTLAISEYVSGDENLAGVVTHSGVGTANGTDNTGAVGTFSNIDEGSGATNSVDDSDVIQLPVAGNRYSMTMPARSFSGRAVRTVVINYRARRGISGPTTIRPYLKIGGTRYYAADQVLTTAFTSSYQAFFNIDPSTGEAWATAAAEDGNLEFGWEAAA